MSTVQTQFRNLKPTPEVMATVKKSGIAEAVANWKATSPVERAVIAAFLRDNQKKRGQ